jgi:aspartate/methionine/tyrosine aminotransferase
MTEMTLFSGRIPTDLRPNRLSQVRARLGAVDHDLTVSNPTWCDLPYPRDLLSELAHPDGLRYEPDPRGPMTARRAIARWYRQFGVELDPTRIVLTASTSEAYGILMRMLANPGDRVAVPCPSYPLFKHLARLDGLGLAPYRLSADDEWRIEPGSLAALPPDCRAAIAVHPNNPTGSFLHEEDLDHLVALCSARQLALVVDEVFLPYPLTDTHGSQHSLAGNLDCLTFTLGGLSKSVGLPQLKLAWIVVGGADDQADQALERLEYVNDAYLSVSTPVARSAPRLLERGLEVHSAILARCRSNLALLAATVTPASPISLLVPSGE